LDLLEVELAAVAFLTESRPELWKVVCKGLEIWTLFVRIVRMHKPVHDE